MAVSQALRNHVAVDSIDPTGARYGLKSDALAQIIHEYFRLGGVGSPIQQRAPSAEKNRQRTQRTKKTRRR